MKRSWNKEMQSIMTSRFVKVSILVFNLQLPTRYIAGLEYTNRESVESMGTYKWKEKSKE
jgi:hypothetical protein